MEKYIDAITAVLKDLENRGEIVVINTIPKKISEEIYFSAVKLLIESSEKFEEPIEATLPFLLGKNISQVTSLFGLGESEAKILVGKYHEKLLQWKSPKETAELYFHQGSHDIALRAYYTGTLNKNDQSIEYLDWRKSFIPR
jgi:hypothetical protein